MKDINKQNDKLNISKEQWSLVKYKEVRNGRCLVYFVNDEGDNMLTFEGDDIYDLIDKAYDWFNNKFRPSYRRKRIN